MTKIPFDIKYRPQIESGEYKVETKNGVSVRIICWDAIGSNDRKDIIGLTSSTLGSENLQRYDIMGHLIADSAGIGNKDLFIVTPEEEMTEWQRFISACLQKHGLLDCGAADRIAKESAAELLSLAREQFIKDGYIIEKKAFHDAVEKIDDRHKAEMSIEYSLHCKIENGTRHAVMNWEEFQKLAQKFINMGKAEALKDLPRWRKWGNGACGGGKYPIALIESSPGHYFLADCLGVTGEKYIMLSDLEKLPKED